jgi:hypothetical protein
MADTIDLTADDVTYSPNEQHDSPNEQQKNLLVAELGVLMEEIEDRQRRVAEIQGFRHVCDLETIPLKLIRNIKWN